MKYIKTYEGLLDFFKSKQRLSDEQLVHDYIEHFKHKMLDFNVIKTSEATVFLSTYEFEVNNLNLSIKFGENTPDNKPNIIVDNKILKVNQHTTLDLQRVLKDITFRNMEFIRQIKLQLSNTTFDELQDRIIEFEIVKDDGDIDEISLRSLFDFYNAHPSETVSAHIISNTRSKFISH